MPDLVPSHCMPNVNSSKPSTTATAVTPRQINHDPHPSISNDDSNNYGGHQIHHLINSPISAEPHTIAHPSHMNTSSQHSSAVLFDHVPGIILFSKVAKQDIIYIVPNSYN